MQLFVTRGESDVACVGIVEGRRVIAGMTGDTEWKRITALCKTRVVLMPDTGLPALAKTRRWDGGTTRYFSHFPGEAPAGYTNRESPEHMAMKLAIYKRLVEHGIPVELEDGLDDWRADLLVGASAFGPALAIEVQLTAQSAQKTYVRTEQRQRSGIRTLWLFGPKGLTGHLADDLLLDNPVFSVHSPGQAAYTARQVCSGKAFYDDLSAFRQTPARPIAYRVHCDCGKQWLYPYGVLLLTNRLCADAKPVFIACGRSAKEFGGVSNLAIWNAAEAHLNRYLPTLKRAAAAYNLLLGTPMRLGRTYSRKAKGRVWAREFACPYCAVIPASVAAGLPRGVDIERCPVPVTETVDARPHLSLSPMWRTEPCCGRMEVVMPEATWKTTFIQSIKERGLR